jgi:hypothetical protein
MNKPLASLVALVLLIPGALRADEHLVRAGEAEQRMVGAATERGRDLAAVAAFVDSAPARAALAAAGLDARRVHSALPALDDTALREIAARVGALEADPVAGAAFTGKQVGIGAAIILIVVFIIIIA